MLVEGSLTVRCLCWSKKYLSAKSLSSFGITVYREVMATVKRNFLLPGKLNCFKRVIRVLYVCWQRFNERSHFLVQKARDKFCWETAGRNDQTTGTVRLVDFRFKIKCRCFRCCDEKIVECRGQYFFRNKFVFTIFDNFLVGECKVFDYFGIGFGVGKLPKIFLFVKVDAPYDHSTA